MEPEFDRAQDALWKLHLRDGRVVIERDAWRKRGDANMWLISDVMDLPRPYSREAEAAMARAEALMATDSPSRDDINRAHVELQRVLVDSDPFWLSWRYWKRERGVA